MELYNDTQYDVILRSGAEELLCPNRASVTVPTEFFDRGGVTMQFDAVTTMKSEHEETPVSLNGYRRRYGITTNVYFGDALIKGTPGYEAYEITLCEKQSVRLFHRSSKFVYPGIVRKNEKGIPQTNDLKTAFLTLKHENDVERIRSENKTSLVLSSIALLILLILAALPLEISVEGLSLWILLLLSALYEFLQSVIQLRRFRLRGGEGDHARRK